MIFLKKNIASRDRRENNPTKRIAPPVLLLLGAVGAQVCRVELVGRAGPGPAVRHHRLGRQGVRQVGQGREAKVDGLGYSDSVL